MKIGLIDVDGHNFPNLALMKISAWHKSQGDTVEWCLPLDHYDIVYQSKVFDETYQFCIVAGKEGRRSIKVADLSEFWSGQKKIVLLDPNILACREHPDLLQQLIDSKAWVDINQGLDIRLTNEQNIELLNRIKIKEIHFAWDNAEDDLKPYFAQYKALAKHKPHGHYGTVYCLTNFGSTMEENLYRIYTLRDLDFDPYVMVYDKPNAPREIKDLQRWCNNKFIFRSCERFEDYKKGG